MVVSIIILYLIVGCAELGIIRKSMNKRMMILYITLLVIVILIGVLSCYELIPRQLYKVVVF